MITSLFDSTVGLKILVPRVLVVKAMISKGYNFIPKKEGVIESTIFQFKG